MQIRYYTIISGDVFNMKRERDYTYNPMISNVRHEMKSPRSFPMQCKDPTSGRHPSKQLPFRKKTLYLMTTLLCSVVERLLSTPTAVWVDSAPSRSGTKKGQTWSNHVPSSSILFLPLHHHLPDILWHEYCANLWKANIAIENGS